MIMLWPKHYSRVHLLSQVAFTIFTQNQKKLQFDLAPRKPDLSSPSTPFIHSTLLLLLCHMLMLRLDNTPVNWLTVCMSLIAHSIIKGYNMCFHCCLDWSKTQTSYQSNVIEEVCITGIYCYCFFAQAYYDDNFFPYWSIDAYNIIW